MRRQFDVDLASTPEQGGYSVCIDRCISKSNSQTKFRFSLVLGLATRGQNQKHKKCYDFGVIAGLAPSFYHDINNRVFDLTEFSRSQRSKFKTAPLVAMFCHYLT
jgi:hypothetical protein